MNLRTIAKGKPERAIAQAAGKKFYDTGRPCSKGHLSPRRTNDAACLACAKATGIARREIMTVYMRERRANASAEVKLAVNQLRAKQQRAARIANPERVRELERKHSRLKRQRHPERKLAEVRKRQAAKQQRTPAWSDLKAIQKFYEARPPDMEIDHIIPLRGKTVCGLHVLNNLQYLTKEANRLKGNRFSPELLV